MNKEKHSLEKIFKKKRKRGCSFYRQMEKKDHIPVLNLFCLLFFILVICGEQPLKTNLLFYNSFYFRTRGEVLILRKTCTMTRRQQANLQEGHMLPPSHILLHHIHKLFIFFCVSPKHGYSGPFSSSRDCRWWTDILSHLH